MSDFLAEARVRITPDTTSFRALLEAQVRAATRTPVPVTVTPVVVGGAQGFASLAAQANVASTAVSSLAVSQQRAGATAEKSSQQLKEQAKTLGNIERAALASAAGMTGLRGAVLTAGGAFIAATVGIQAFGRAVQSAADLETNLNVFRVTAGATADEMERVRDTAKALGRDLTLPGVTASDAAETFLALSRAGLSVQESLGGARGTLQLAVAAQISFAEAAQLTASALNSFQLGGDQAIQVADLLTNAANASQASISDMGIALRQSAAIADRVGFSLSETVTFLTQLARAGLAGSDAGTSFRVSMQRLIAPTSTARKELEKLQLDLRDTAGNLRPEVFFELADALEKQSRSQADLTLQTIFGNDASRAAAFFARINTKAFRDQEQVLNKAGSAAEVAGARNEGFAGSVENLKNQVTALGIELGELSIPALGFAADTAALFFGALATQIGETREVFAGFGEDIGKVAGAVADLSDESGFTQFARDVAEGGRIINQDLENAGNAILGFVSDLTGVEKSASGVTDEFRFLTEGERRLAEAARDNHHVFEEQTTDLNNLSDAAERAAGAVARLAGQQKGLEEQTTRARIAGDEEAELASLREQRVNLEAELKAQEAIIARPGTSGEATARAAIRQRILPQLEAVNNEIENIAQEERARAEAAQRDRENAQEDQIRAREQADREFLDRLGGRRDDAERRAAAAAETEGIGDDIRAQNAIQALIKQQIQKIRSRVSDEKTRRAAIRELRIAIIASRREEEALRAEQRQAVAEQREAAILERGASLELDIQLADINENDARSVALRRRRIAQLKKEARLLKLEGNQLKENRNERARIRKEIEDILREDKEGGKDGGQSAQQFFFEQLQAQQGFAANLMGNLITGPTAGLVGVPSPSTSVRRESAAAEARSTFGPSAGQTNTQTNVLEKILVELKKLNGSYDAPEAINNKKAGGAALDYAAM